MQISQNNRRRATNAAAERHCQRSKRPMSRYFALLFVLLPLMPFSSSAKRIAPKPVTPIIHKGIKYSAPNDNGRTGYVLASDPKSGKKLWEVEIFETKIDPNLEEDVQWVFITDLKLFGNSLVVKDEKSRCYRVDLTTKIVRKDCR